MRVRDMTEGNPLRLMLAFAVPLFIGNIFQQIYRIVDTMVVGYNLGDNAISAVGATYSLHGLLLSVAIGLNSGYAIIVTQKFGAHNREELKQSIAGMILLNGVVTFPVILVPVIFIRPIMRFMNTPTAIFEDAFTYIVIIGVGMIFTIGYNMFAGILRAMGNSRTPLVFLIISSVLNVILDVLLVTGFKMGVAGAALATIMAQGISAVLSGWYIFRNYKEVLPAKEDFRVSKEMFGEMLSAGLAMGLMYSIVETGNVIFQSANNQLGESFITAHTASRTIIGAFTQMLGTLANACATFVGQNWGAGKMDRIKEAIKKILIMQVGLSVVLCVMIYLFGEVLIRFTTGTNNTEIVENAVLSLRCHFTCFGALGVLVTLRSSMQAIGQKKAPLISSGIELVIKIGSAIWLVPVIGFVGTCVTEPVVWIVMMSYLAVEYGRCRKEIFAEQM